MLTKKQLIFLFHLRFSVRFIQRLIIICAWVNCRVGTISYGSFDKALFYFYLRVRMMQNNPNKNTLFWIVDFFWQLINNVSLKEEEVRLHCSEFSYQFILVLGNGASLTLIRVIYASVYTLFDIKPLLLFNQKAQWNRKRYNGREVDVFVCSLP